MSAAVWTLRDTDRSRTRWSMGTSMVVHAALLVWLVLTSASSGPGEPLTEITLLDGDADPAPAAAPAILAAPESHAGALAPSVTESRFERTTARDEVAPTPQDQAFDDRLNARLAAIQSTASRPAVGTLSAAAPGLWGSAPAPVAGPGGSGRAPVALTRGGGVGPAPLVMARGGAGHGVAPALAPSATRAALAEAAAPSGGDAGARRNLAGATLMGPIADREVLSRVNPLYPEWAKRQGVEGAVTVYFIVTPEGDVRENVLVQKTAGFDEFDQNACAALRTWKFERLRDGRVGDQWGTITFHFRLRDGG